MTYFDATPYADSEYLSEKRSRVERFAKDKEFRELSSIWRSMALQKKYMNNFSAFGRPLIQLPTDAMAMQELIWAIKPDLVIETGVAHGGSVVLSASVLELLGNGYVLGVDIEIRPHNRRMIEDHSLSHRIRLIEGSSIEKNTIDLVHSHVEDKKRILVFLDSNHTHDHVFSELEAYAPLVTPGSYCVVFDTFIEDLPDTFTWVDRPWGKGNNPKTAVHKWLEHHSEFEIDKSIEDRLLLTSAPDGFLRKLR